MTTAEKVGKAYMLSVVEQQTINNPKHYNNGKIEVIDFIEDQQFNFNLGNVVKYISRAGLKSKETTLEDLKKAQWYLNREIKKI